MLCWARLRCLGPSRLSEEGTTRRAWSAPSAARYPNGAVYSLAPERQRSRLGILPSQREPPARLQSCDHPPAPPVRKDAATTPGASWAPSRRRRLPPPASARRGARHGAQRPDSPPGHSRPLPSPPRTTPPQRPERSRPRRPGAPGRERVPARVVAPRSRCPPAPDSLGGELARAAFGRPAPRRSTLQARSSRSGRLGGVGAAGLTRGAV